MAELARLAIVGLFFVLACGPKRSPQPVGQPVGQGLSAAGMAEVLAAERALAVGDGEAALRAYRRALMHEPGNGIVQVRLGMALIHAGQVDAALDVWQEVAQADGAGAAVAWQALADVALATELWEQAEMALRRAHAVGGDWRVEAALFLVLSKQNKQVEARAQLDGWLARDAVTTNDRAARGQAGAMLGACSAGLVDLGAVLAVRPTDANSLEGVLHCARIWNFVGSALNLLERTLALSPDASLVRQALRDLAIETGDPYRSAAACAAASGLPACNADRQAVIAEMMQGLSRRTVQLDPDMDLAAVLVALERDPTDVAAWGRRGQIMWQAGDVEVALAHFSTAVRYAPADATLRDWMHRAGSREEH